MSTDTSTVRSNYALRLQSSLKAEAEAVARAEGTTLNQFINVAVAEQLSALRTATYFEERAHRANLDEALAVLDRIGTSADVREGDDLADDDPAKP